MLTNISDIVTDQGINLKDTGHGLSQNYEMPKSYRYLVLVITCFIGISGIFGNVMMFVVALMNEKMKLTNNRFMMFLAVSDMVFLACSLPAMTPEYIFPHETMSVLWCKISRYFIYASAFIAIYTIVLMSLDRYSALVFPLRSIRYRTKQAVTIGLLIISVFSFVICTPALIIFIPYEKNLSEPQITGRCTIKQTSSGADPIENVLGQVFLLLIFTTFGYIIPVIALVCMHLTIYNKLKHPGTLRISNSNYHAAIHARATRSIMLLFLTFLVCWTPIQVLYTLIYFAGLRKSLSFYQLHIILDTSHGLAVLNGCLYPFLYALSSAEYRSIIRRVFNNFKNTFESMTRCFKP